MSEIKMLREIETKWLAKEIGEAIANLGYAVGMGVAPKQGALDNAASKLFERYADMIECARVEGAKMLIDAAAEAHPIRARLTRRQH